MPSLRTESSHLPTQHVYCEYPHLYRVSRDLRVQDDHEQLMEAMKDIQTFLTTTPVFSEYAPISQADAEKKRDDLVAVIEARLAAKGVTCNADTFTQQAFDTSMCFEESCIGAEIKPPSITQDQAKEVRTPAL